MEREGRQREHAVGVASGRSDHDASRSRRTARAAASSLRGSPPSTRASPPASRAASPILRRSIDALGLLPSRSEPPSLVAEPLPSHARPLSPFVARLGARPEPPFPEASSSVAVPGAAFEACRRPRPASRASPAPSSASPATLRASLGIPWAALASPRAPRRLPGAPKGTPGGSPRARGASRRRSRDAYFTRNDTGSLQLSSPVRTSACTWKKWIVPAVSPDASVSSTRGPGPHHASPADESRAHAASTTDEGGRAPFHGWSSRRVDDGMRRRRVFGAARVPRCALDSPRATPPDWRGASVQRDRGCSARVDGTRLSPPNRGPFTTSI